MTVIVYHSYKGGTGKTTLALNTAIKMAKKGFKTLAIDADLKAPTFDSIFNKVTPTYYFNDLFEEKPVNFDKGFEKPTIKDLPVNSRLHENLDLVFANPKPKFGQGLLSMDKAFHANALKRLVATKKEFEGMGYEYIIIDVSPSLNLASINALIIADATMIVLRPNKYGINGTTFLLRELYSMLGKERRKDFILFNQVVPGTPRRFIAKWERHFQNKLAVKTIGVIPCNCKIALHMTEGKMIIDESVSLEFAGALETIVENLLREFA